jgi:hypothetical protein
MNFYWCWSIHWDCYFVYCITRRILKGGKQTSIHACTPSEHIHYVYVQAPIAVYTSGKGSSAAGLTATVVKSAAGEFYLEVSPPPPPLPHPLSLPPSAKYQQGQYNSNRR